MRATTICTTIRATTPTIKTTNRTKTPVAVSLIVDDDSMRHPEADLELEILSDIAKAERKGTYEGTFRLDFRQNQRVAGG